MALTHDLTLKWSSGSRSITKIIACSGGAQTSVDEDVATGATDYLITFTCDVSEIQAIYINSTQDVTLETNSGAAPGNTLALVANEPYIWWSTSLLTNLLTVDVTALYITNASGETATIQIEVLYDPTP